MFLHKTQIEVKPTDKETVFSNIYINITKTEVQIIT